MRAIPQKIASCNLKRDITKPLTLSLNDLDIIYGQALSIILHKKCSAHIPLVQRILLDCFYCKTCLKGEQQQKNFFLLLAIRMWRRRGLQRPLMSLSCNAISPLWGSLSHDRFCVFILSLVFGSLGHLALLAVEFWVIFGKWSYITVSGSKFWLS
jgi:hypothetical protein